MVIAENGLSKAHQFPVGEIDYSPGQAKRLPGFSIVDLAFPERELDTC